MAMTATLKVDPQVLSTKASDFSGIRSKISSNLESTKTAIDSLKAQWESDASTSYQRQFLAASDDIIPLLQIVDEYANDLAELATLYTTTEQRINEISSALPGDVF
ncbi:MAG: WXG100 family type VII secretion target [Oscillospiraceae bacterium]|jgi:WXG100 family type VII secretion target|nr:WXG100 family type VII secretion target [Oscillospiraceae bacterium]